MKFFSTRGGVSGLTFKNAVMMGLADDGGLLLPSSFPKIDVDELREKSYAEVAYEIIKGFADDIEPDVLKEIINKSYSTFSHPLVTPVVNIKECYVAELFHGPTYAFKDIALQLLGNLFELILKENNETLNIIGATSGDTGSAAIHGVRGKENINIAILYPDKRVSKVQEMQMTSVLDKNVHTLAVKGTFDDCQSLLKGYFADTEFKQKYNLGAVNSVNWARVMAQIVYYFYSYIQMPGKEKVNFVVPTGNFGNIFAGYCAMMMGLPVEKLVLATNENDILHRFISNGDYSIADVKPTHSPSMDIQMASNFERYLYYLFNKDSKKVKVAMDEFKTKKRIDFTNTDIAETQKYFDSYGATNAKTEDAIKRIYQKSGYILDPHTACGVEAAYNLWLDPARTIVMATAHPSKFGDVVKKVLKFTPEEPESIRDLAGKETKQEAIENNTDLIKKRLVEFFS